MEDWALVQISLPRKGTETELKKEERKTKIEDFLPHRCILAKCSSFFFLPFSFFPSHPTTPQGDGNRAEKTKREKRK